LQKLPDLRKAETVADVVISANAFVGKGIGPITENYKIGKVLGEGAFGSVREATHKLNHGRRAIKAIRRDKSCSKRQEEKFINEVSLLTQMDHPHIVKVFEYYIDAIHFHLVTDLYTGGELLDYIIEQHGCSEKIAAVIMKQTLSVLVY
jgi:serine/threonine protein kinase